MSAMVKEGRADGRLLPAGLPETVAPPAKITTRHLLSHQSGIPHYGNGKIVPVERLNSLPTKLSVPLCGKPVSSTRAARTG